MSAAPVIEVVDVHKSFGHVHVLRGVELCVSEGEIVALVGDNGAGKSTLLKIIAGVLQADRGEIRLSGAAVHFASAHAALASGIEMVYQDLALAPHLEVSANLFLGREIMRKGLLGWLGFLDNRAMRRDSMRDLDQLGLRLRENLATARVFELSGGQQQAVAVARALTWGKRLLILDEPTAALGVRETAHTLDAVRRIREERGLSVLLVTHDIPSALRIADRFVVLRLGRAAATFDADAVTVDELVAAITGASAAEVAAPGADRP